MAIRLNKRGCFVVDYYTNGRRGKRVMFTLPQGTSREQAISIEQEVKTRRKEYHGISASGRISTLIDHYLSYCTLHQSSGTVRDKRSHYKTHIIPYFGRLHIGELTNTHLLAYKQQMQTKQYRGNKITNQTITKGMNYFSAFLKWAADQYDIHPPQALRFRRLPHIRPVPVVLSISEAQAFIDAADAPYNILFKIFFYLGLRNRAARHLKWEDVDWSRVAIRTYEKGGKVRWHPVPDDLLSEIRALYVKSSSPWIFPSPVNSEKPINNITKSVRRAKIKAGISKRIYPHLLRHSIATHLVDSDVDLRQIQAFLGHKQVTTTEWYSQVSFEKKRQALEKAGIKTTKRNVVTRSKLEK